MLDGFWEYWFTKITHTQNTISNYECLLVFNIECIKLNHESF